MKDQFKKYIEENRDEFDILEPAPEVLQRIKFQMQTKKVQPQKKTVKLISYKWMVAASVVIVAMLTLLVYNRYSRLNKPANSTLVKQHTQVPPENNIGNNVTGTTQDVPAAKFAQAKIKEKKQFKPSRSNIENTKKENWMIQLKDSSSASTRLAAILAIEKTGTIDNYIVNQLAKTLNHDGNTNVRLAALNILSKYKQDEFVENTLKNSFAVQKDPILQLGLISLIGNINDKKVEKTLFALANNPTTMDAVKDEAYQILLNQNKL